MTLKNLRAYTPGDNDTDTSKVAVDASDTGSTNGGILRKINLNVDLATQNELNEAFTTLSNAITATGTAWKDADIQLSNDLKAWAKGDELSGALHTEITAEADRATTAEQAIRDSLSTYALSTTVADAYKVTVSAPVDAEGDKLRYGINQGGTQVGYLDIAKDQFVSAAVFEGTVLTLTLRDGSKISTDLGTIADYAGVDGENATVTIGDDHKISVYVKDYASKSYVDTVSAAISAAADANFDEKGAAAAAQTAAETSAKNYTDEVSSALDARLTAVEGAQHTHANKTVLDGITAEKVAAWDAAESNAKAYTNDVSAALSTTLHNEVDAEKTARETADTALSNAIDALSGSVNGASGDDYVSATVEDNKVKVSATDLTKGAVDKVAAESATWDAALQAISAGTDGTYVTTTVGAKDANNKQTVAVAVTTHDLSTAVAVTSNGLAVAADAKAYVDAAVAAKNVTAEGDNYVSASAADNKVTVTATDKLTAVVDKVEKTSATWDAAAPLSDLNAEVTRATGAEEALGTKIDNLSATYASKTTVDGAATTLEGAAALTAKDLSAYNDIDEIIQELEDLKAAVKAFAGTLKTA